jgi:hypothetical protein
MARVNAKMVATETIDASTAEATTP